MWIRSSSAKARETVVLVVLSVLFGVGCVESTRARASSSNGTQPDSSQVLVSHHEVMVSMVNHGADPLWAAASQLPTDDGQWRVLERHAYQLKIAGALLSVPGRSSKDVQRAADPNWKRWSLQLSDAGGQAVEAIRSRDQEAISRAGDLIVDICQGCHMQFRSSAGGSAAR